MKRKNAKTPLLMSLGMIALAIIAAFLDPTDMTASLLIGFFALVAIAETIERIRYNCRLVRYRKDAFRAVKHRYATYADDAYERAK